MGSKDISNEKCVMTDSQIVDLFLSRNEKAIEVTETKYKGLINSVCFGILNDMRDCEECENSVYVRLWDTIPPEKPRSLKAYIIRLTRFAALDRFRSEHRKKRISSDMTEALDDFSVFLSDDYTVEDEVLRKELIKALNDFLDFLPAKRKRIFVKRYYYFQSVFLIAHDEGLKYKKVKNELESIKDELQIHLTKKGLI